MLQAFIVRNPLHKYFAVATEHASGLIWKSSRIVSRHVSLLLRTMHVDYACARYTILEYYWIPESSVAALSKREGK